MKNVLLSADNNPSVYSVPNIVADNLREYCIQHFYKWLEHSPKSKKYRQHGGYCFDETVFIEYLNIDFPHEKSVLIEALGWINNENDIPDRYKSCEWFNF